MDAHAIEREGLSERGVQRVFGIGRRRLAEARAAGELRAARLGVRRFLYLRRDVEAYLARHAVTPAADQRVDEILAREARR